MGIIVNYALLTLLLRVLDFTQSPKTCAIIYAGFKFFYGIVFGTLFLGTDFIVVLLGSIISFFLAYGFFWLLDRLDGRFMWWVVFIIGAIVLFF
ncbi:UNVERIFIED_CONTAM: hypothetical protein Cloal_2246 [Acetivibrio alkalicellulosi]